MICVQSASFIMSCAQQLYDTENRHVLIRHPATAAVLQDMTNCHTISMNASSCKHMSSGKLLKMFALSLCLLHSYNLYAWAHNMLNDTDCPHTNHLSACKV